MNLLVNGENLSIEAEKVTILSVIESTKISTLGVAIAVGISVVPQSKWSEYVLEEGDKVTIIRATQGG